MKANNQKGIEASLERMAQTMKWQAWSEAFALYWKRSMPWIFVPFLGLVLREWLEKASLMHSFALLTLYAVCVWLVLCMLARRRMGTQYEALLRVDQIIQSKDLYSNAWIIQRDESLKTSLAAQLHLRKAMSQIDLDYPHIRDSIQLPWTPWKEMALGLGLGLLLMFVNPIAHLGAVGNSSAQSEAVIVDAKIAAEVSAALQELADESLDLQRPKMELLALVQEQQSQLKDLAARLKNEPETDLLNSVEALEAVAQGLDQAVDTLEKRDTRWLSESMGKFLESKELTQLFAIQVHQESLIGTWQEASALLNRFQLERRQSAGSQVLTQTLTEVGKHQDEKDSERWIGSFMVRIAVQLEQKLWMEAEAVLKEMVDRLQQQLANEENRKKLESLRDRVREENTKLGGESSSLGGNQGQGEAEGPEGLSDTGRDLPRLSPDAMAPPQSPAAAEIQEGEKQEIQVADESKKGEGGVPSAQNQSGEKKRAQFFAPIPGMTEDQAKKLSPNFMVEGQRNDDPTPGETGADLKTEESDFKTSQKVAKVTPASLGPDGDSQVSAVNPNKLLQESVSVSESDEARSVESTKEQSLNLKKVPLTHREMVSRYFKQLGQK